MSINDISKFKHLFIEEATSLLNSMESIILELESHPNNLDLIQEVFRVMHTIKGVSGMYAYQGMSDLTHSVENIYDLIRNGIVPVSQDILDTTLTVVDQLFALLKDKDIEDEKNASRQKELLYWCETFLANVNHSNEKIQLKKNSDSHKKVTYNVILHTLQSVVDRKINIFYTIKDLAEIGEIKSINPLAVEAEEEERWSIFIVGEFGNEDIEDALMFVYEYCIIRKVADFDIFNNKELDENQNELLAEELMHHSKAEQSVITTSDKLTPSSIKTSKPEAMIDSIKQNMNRVAVDSEKLDHLMYLVSELITTSSQLNLTTTSNNYNSIRSHLEKLDKLSKQFRNNALDIRLIPIRDIMPKFNRLVRDVSLDLGKEVEFLTEGMSTELDKTSIDMVAEPLVHMIRNALDHGIESPEIREENGKTRKGVIKLKAYNSGSDIFIEVSDDGKGLNKDKIIEKAIEKGLINNRENLNNKEALFLICQPGFTTASEVTSISGRGVGMDVVRQKIAEMRGELEISSEVGKGSLFTIKLQQSIAILDTLLIRSNKMKFLLPLSDVEVCTQKPYHEINDRLHHGTIDHENELIPFISIRKLFELEEHDTPMAKMIIIKKNNLRCAICADEIIGQHQAVLKPMGDLVKSHKEISAASVLGNGEVAFLLDTNSFKYDKHYDS
ncbi:chemotaxis protein CheA [Labilibacter sediminis]|nr:chemotaxis protein CheA [Labilibacter sediminis]